MFDGSGKRVVSTSGTQALMETYPASVRAWIARHGGLTRKMMYLRGRDLAAIVVPCNNSRAALASRAKRLGGFHQDSDTNIQIRLAPGLMRADQRAHMLWLVHSRLPPQPRNLRERMPRRDLVYVRLWHFSDGRRQSCDVRCWEFTGPKSAAPEGRLLTKAESWDEE